jgi:hypothetical protein
MHDDIDVDDYTGLMHAWDGSMCYRTNAPCPTSTEHLDVGKCGSK